ncbi:MAG: T9SS type A sorting domain-containing protein [Bacteroidetes bacterium]|nr:T9SS type A sorting domain-containing protein [Bacteroidota bacterium]MBL6963149.1 T9SS type A sorting domain-containing protein [Bacteroidota bacterium]
MKIIPIIYALLLLCYYGKAQVEWQKHAANPVLSKGASSFEAIALGQPVVLFEQDTIKMWYAAVGTDMKARISYAWSLDGINWNKINNATPVFDVGLSGSWDSGWLDAPEVVHGPEGYKLYYYGDVKQQGPEISSAYGLATSPDGINWTRHASNPVFSKADSAKWDGKWIESPAVLYDEKSGQYMMWYSGVGWNWLIHIGLATSPDGITWTRHPNNPIISLGPSKSFDDMWMAVPSVIKTNNTFEMWYSGFSSISAFDTLRIGYATSVDGINWTKHKDNPVYDRFYSPFDTLNDQDGPWAPDVIFDSTKNTYLMFYEGTSGIQLAASPKTVSIPAVDPECSSFHIDPNTSENGQILRIENKTGSTYTLIVLNAKGQIVYCSENISSQYHQVSCSILSSGVYFARLMSSNNQQTFQIIR